MTIKHLQSQLAECQGQPVKATLEVCVTGVTSKTTRDGKPFYEVAVRDFDDTITLRVWDNHPAFGACRDEAVSGFVAITGTFTAGKFGIESGDWSCEALSKEQVEQCLTGSEERREIQRQRRAAIVALVDSLQWPFRPFADRFLSEYEAAFHRAAAARGNHHARPGGLSEHVAQMMQSAAALAGVYPEINRDLLIAGALVHDCGKMWENQYAEGSFDMPYNQRSELLGHIAIGLLVCRKIWEEVLAAEPDQSRRVQIDRARLHLDHLILSHHGTHEWGSPVLPKTPEAMLLHFIDNIDARMEMFRNAYESSAQVAPGIHERHRAIGSCPVRPLASVAQSIAPADSANASESAKADQLIT